MVMDIDKTFGYDEDLAAGGVKYVLDAEGKQFFLLRKIPNDDYTRLLAKEYRRHENVLKLKGDNAEELSERLMARILAKTVVIGWEGVGLKGKKLAYSYENAVKVMVEYPLLRAALVDYAQDVGNFRVEEDIESVKKS